MKLSIEQLQTIAASLRAQWSGDNGKYDQEAFQAWLEIRKEIGQRRSSVRRNSYRVVFRDSTVVEEDLIFAGSMVEAALEAECIRDDRWPDWSVYSITLR